MYVPTWTLHGILVYYNVIKSPVSSDLNKDPVYTRIYYIVYTVTILYTFCVPT